MRKLVIIAVVALSFICASLVQAQDMTACIVAQKVNDRGDFERAISLYTTCIEEGDLFDRTKSVALNNRGNVYLNEKRYNYARSARFEMENTQLNWRPESMAPQITTIRENSTPWQPPMPRPENLNWLSPTNESQ